MMIMKKFLKKRNVLVSALLALLGVVGYFNYQLTQSSLLQSSEEYKKHEEIKLSSLEKQEDGKTLEASTKNIEIIDSKENKEVSENKNVSENKKVEKTNSKNVN